MVESVQDEIEIEGFTQIVTGHTRSWQNQADSLLDHIWTNRRDRIIRHANCVRSDPCKLLRRAFNRWMPPGGKPKFSLKYVNSVEVYKMIKELKNSSAYGHDDLDSNTFKIAAPVIVPTVTHLINLSLGTSTFSQRWKITRLLPLLKSSNMDKHQPSLYRPVAQLSVLSKLVEQTIQKQLLSHLEEFNMIASQHHAYRLKYSTMTALV